MKQKDIEAILQSQYINPTLLEAIQHDHRTNVQKVYEKRQKKYLVEQEERSRLLTLYRHEMKGLEFGLSVGIDEAGRGPLAGPVYAAAVILPLGLYVKGLRDSKKIKHDERKNIRKEIEARALSVGWGYASVEEIEAVNILQATYLAMQRAYRSLSIQGDIVLVDGHGNPGIENVMIKPIIGGDNESASIAAASIIAKERRDEIMLSIHESYPQYGFDQHKGYGTKEHIEAIKRYGPSIVHRQSFLKKVMKI